MRIVPLALAGLAAACGARSPTPAVPEPPPAPTPQQCEQLATRWSEWIADELTAAGDPAADEAAARQTARVRNACLQHGDARSLACLLEANDLTGARRCARVDPP